MTNRTALLIADAHLLDLVTMLAVFPLFANGEYGFGAGFIYPVAGLAGVAALKVAGIGLFIAGIGQPKLHSYPWLRLLALSLVVLAGLFGATVNALAYSVIR